MARIVFVQRIWYEFPGTTILSACLKERGHETDVVIARSPEAALPVCVGADIVAFSVMTGFQGWALATADRIRSATGALIVFGGPHPTHVPEIIREPPVDIVCRGEGEGALADLADRVDRREDVSDIPNLWVKRAHGVVCNGVRPLIADLDALPLPDRTLYYRRYPRLARNPHKSFLAGRGCPYSCSFCSNEALRDLYRGKGSFVRVRSPERVIEELAEVKRRFPLSRVFFHDDTFVLNHAWLFRFLDLYERSIALPFYCQSRADTLNEAVAARLNAAGCRSVFFAIESGREHLRCSILRKELSDGAILQAARLLRKYGITMTTYNVIGTPGETVEDALATVSMNIAVKADFPRCSFLTPYPGTSLGGDASCNAGRGARGITPLSQQTGGHVTGSESRELRNVHALFQTAVLFPWTFPLVRRLVRLRLGPVYRIWWGVVYALVFVRSEGRSFASLASFLPVLFRQRNGG